MNNSFSELNLKIEIVSSFYIPKDNERFDELVKALNKNLKNKYINNIHLFVDNEKCIDYLKNKFNKLFY